MAPQERSAESRKGQFRAPGTTRGSKEGAPRAAQRTKESAPRQVLSPLEYFHLAICLEF
jgi:hypothetical protein